MALGLYGTGSQQIVNSTWEISAPLSHGTNWIVPVEPLGDGEGSQDPSPLPHFENPASR